MSTLNDLPVLFAARYPDTDRWFVDTDEAFVRGVAGSISPPAEVVRVDVPALLRAVRAAQEHQTCGGCGGRGLYWMDVDGEAEAEACDCIVELTDALAALEKEVPDVQNDR